MQSNKESILQKDTNSKIKVQLTNAPMYRIVIKTKCGSTYTFRNTWVFYKYCS